VEHGWGTARVTEIVPYSELERALESGRVERVVVGERHIVGYLKTPTEKKTGVTFDDVAGVDEAKEELREVVDICR
jgi:ATP-dependent 26S proteasome regulatory subunit